jgi:uncharacterized damage-inducible protein DinB
MDRTDPDLRADERTSLCQFLDFHRATLVSRIEGLTIEQLSITRRPSELTLAGLIKHLALVEDSWFVERMAGRPMPEPWLSAPFDDDPDWEFHSAPDDTPEELLALYRDACDRSRAVVAEHDELGALSVAESNREGEGRFSLRWILLHMIEETARHNGHADLLRESIDGLTGE